MMKKKFILQVNIVEELPSDMVLDLTRNIIKKITGSPYLVTHSKNSSSLIILKENPIDCDCSSYTLWQSSLKVEMEKMKCLPSFNSSKCRAVLETSVDVVPLVIPPIVIAFILAILVVYFRFQIEIRVWMFSHRCCLWLVTQHEIDEDKTYDAFVSFSHHVSAPVPTY